MGDVGGGPPAALDAEPLDNQFSWAAEHALRYVATGGAGEDRSPDGAPVLLLTTVGRRSGQARRNPLVFGRRGPDYVLVAAKGGAAENPAWFGNLVAEPEVVLQVLDRRMHATARVAQAQERDELFALMLEVLPALEGYRRRTEREIPLVVVTPHG